MKFGVDVRRQQFNQFYYFNVNGEFNYYGGGPNDVRSGQILPEFSVGSSRYIRTRLGAREAYSQHWILSCLRKTAGRSRPNLTLNYGLRWELNTPLADIVPTRRDFPSRPIVYGLSLRRTEYRLHVARRDWLGCSGRPRCSSGHDSNLLQGVCSAHRHRLESGQFRQDQHSRGLGTFL